MKTTKVFKSGNSLAVRIPSGLLTVGKEVIIFKRDGDLIIREVPHNLRKAFETFSQFSDDFFAEGRQDLPPQERDLF